MFARLVQLLQDNPLFHSKGKKCQLPVHKQLACFLFRFGVLGSDTLATAQAIGVGHGSVTRCCRRVTRALRELSPRYIYWPNRAQKREISRAFKRKWGGSNCVGCGDGSLIRFSQAPHEFTIQYFSRKKFPAVGVLLGLNWYQLTLYMH